MSANLLFFFLKILLVTQLSMIYMIPLKKKVLIWLLSSIPTILRPLKLMLRNDLLSLQIFLLILEHLTSKDSVLLNIINSTLLEGLSFKKLKLPSNLNNQSVLLVLAADGLSLLKAIV